MWKKGLIVFGLALTANVAQAQLVDDERIIGRGDANSDDSVNLSDVTTITNYLYQGGPAPPCMNQADANNDGQVNISDAVYLLNWLYYGGSAPPSPGPYNTICTADDSPYPGCQTSTCS
jgi:hypothetical protein